MKGSDLPADVRYEALSYKWGPPQPEQLFTINGIKTHICENLGLALRRL
jgi:hypothetical protein